ncbi:MAG TPA: hypothetical protein VLK82_12555 [Candidatus Tectomicrobia bacterium]|nr:hypothetical protein [Candidatus Tectomicrobia bacterium]
MIERDEIHPTPTFTAYGIGPHHVPTAGAHTITDHCPELGQQLF